MRRLSLPAIATLLVVAGCGPASTNTKSDGASAAIENERVTFNPENPSQPPSLDMVTLSDAASSEDKAVTRRLHVQFGYWKAKCTASKEGMDPVAGWCDLSPALANIPTNSSVMLPAENRATVGFFKDDPAKVILRTQPRVRASRLSFDCGFAKWSGPEEYDRLKFFYDKDAAKFTNSMKRNDCELSFTPKNTAQPVTITIPSHGFKEAFEFGKTFSRKPKLS